EEAVRLDAEDDTDAAPRGSRRKGDRARIAAHDAGLGEENPRRVCSAESKVDRVGEIAVRRIVYARLFRRADPNLERVDRLRARVELANQIGTRERIGSEPSAAVVRGCARIAGRRVVELGAVVELNRAWRDRVVREVAVHQLIPLRSVARPGATRSSGKNEVDALVVRVVLV